MLAHKIGMDSLGVTDEDVVVILDVISRALILGRVGLENMKEL
jgi:hypothetical protein